MAHVMTNQENFSLSFPFIMERLVDTVDLINTFSHTEKSDQIDLFEEYNYEFGIQIAFFCPKERKPYFVAKAVWINEDEDYEIDERQKVEWDLFDDRWYSKEKGFNPKECAAYIEYDLQDILDPFTFLKFG